MPDHNGSLWTHPAVVAAIATAVIGGLFALGAAYISSSGDSDNRSSPVPNGSGPTITTAQPVGPSSEVSSGGSGSSGGSPESDQVPDPVSAMPPSAGVPGSTVAGDAESSSAVGYLADLDPVSGYVKTGSSTIGSGQTYPKSVMFNFNSYQPTTDPVIYNIPPGASAFSATLGIDNQAHDELAFQFSVYVDNVYQGSYRIGLYDSQGISINVTGHSRLKLEVEAVSRHGNDLYYGKATWGDARFS